MKWLILARVCDWMKAEKRRPPERLIDRQVHILTKRHFTRAPCSAPLSPCDPEDDGREGSSGHSQDPFPSAGWKNPDSHCDIYTWTHTDDFPKLLQTYSHIRWFKAGYRQTQKQTKSCEALRNLICTKQFFRSQQFDPNYDGLSF